MIIRELICGIMLMSAVIGCRDRDKSGQLLDTPTSGAVKMAADESLMRLVQAEEFAFESTYPGADIMPSYVSEDNAINLLLQDSVRFIVITRTLSDDERAVLARQAINVHEVAIATSGVALIAHRNSPDTLLTRTELSNLLHTDSTSASSRTVVFEHPRSSVLRTVLAELGVPGISASRCFAVDGSPEVVEYVSRNENALGLIDVSWISDIDDSVTHAFTKKVNVISVEYDSAFYQPYQAYLARKKYPLLRKVYIVSREARAGLASGFIAYCAGDKGQRVVLKSGLVPETMPVRIVQIKNQSLN